jgi:rRNA-processing protein FCF1
MPVGPNSPFFGTRRLIVDGTNLLFRLGGAGRAAPPAAVIGKLRAAVPKETSIDLVFDGQGHGVFGRLAEGMYVRYSGRREADDLILDLVGDALMEAGGGPAAGATVLVVSNDRELRERILAKGSRTVPLQWLIERMGLPVLQAPAAGNRRAPVGFGQEPGGGGPSAAGREDDRPGWKPGRGATSKTGAARKVARHKRHPRMGA